MSHVHIVVVKSWNIPSTDAPAIENSRNAGVFKFREDARRWAEDNGPWGEWRQFDIEMHDIVGA